MKRRSVGAVGLIAFALLLIGVEPAAAQLPVTRLSTVFPPGGQRGTSVEVTVAGTDLDELVGLHFSSRDIVAESKLDAATGKPVPNVFMVRIGRDARPGAYDVRAAGRFGVSNPRAFVVDAEPHAAAKAGNVTPESAAPLAPGTGVYAVAATAAAPQFFKTELKANQRVFVECDAVAIDSKLEPVVVLSDAAGRELARGAEGAPIDVTPPSDGAYVVQVHDVLHRGGAEYFYRLRVRSGGRIDLVLPPAIGRDEVREFKLFGRNLGGGGTAGPALDGKPLEVLSTRVLDASEADDPAGLGARWFVPPAAAMLDGARRYALGGNAGPVFLGTAAAPMVAEAADNDDPAKAQKLTLPVELYGQFFPRGDRDWASFDAKKGEAFWFEVTSNRVLGFTDPMVLVQRVLPPDAKGAEQPPADVKEAYEPENVPGMHREFYAAHRDPAFRFAAPEDGTYRVLVRDLFNEGGADDPRRAYRLCITPAADRQDFRLVAWTPAPQPLVPTAAMVAAPTTQVWGSNLRPGGVTAVSVLAVRTGGFAGEITLGAEGLPAGVTCPPVLMSAGANAATLLFVADEKAPPFVGPVRVVGRAAVGDSRLARVARPGAVVWGVTDSTSEPWRSRVAQELVLAVTGGEIEPISVQAAEDKVWEQSVAGVIEVPLKVTRRGAYAGVVKLKPAGPAQLAAAAAFDVAPGAAAAKLVLDVGALSLPAGNHTVHLQAASTGAYDRYPAQLAAANVAKAAADKSTPELAAAAQKAKDALAAAKAANPAKPDDVAAAEKALAAAEANAKQNEQAKAALAEQLKALAQKEVTAYAYSPPIHVKITPAPITVALAAPEVTLKPGGKAEVPVTIARLYGFADPVELSVAAPAGVAGLSAANATVAQAATQATVSVQAAADAKPGDYTLTLSANLKQNARPVKVDVPLRVKVLPP